MSRLLDSNYLPHKLVENRVSYAGPHAELSVYDTYLPVSNVELSSGELLYCGMIQGRKVMHGFSDETEEKESAIEFLPHESFVMAPGTRVEIDFPEAKMKKPTRCLTVEVSVDRVKQIASQLHHQDTLPDSVDQWHASSQQILHVTHTQGTQLLLERLFSSFTQNDSDRDLAIDFGVSELVTRLLRHQGREFLLHNSRHDPEQNGIHASLAWLEAHLSEPLDVNQLCKVACMSRSRFYSVFKRQLGCTPAELQQQLRLKKAANRLTEGESVTQVCFDLGYSSLSHFNHRFQKQFGRPPSTFTQTAQSETVGQ